MERRIEARAGLALTFGDAARLLEREPLGCLLGIGSRGDAAETIHLGSGLTGSDDLSHLVDIEVGETRRHDAVVMAAMSIDPLEPNWGFGPFRGQLEVRPDGSASVLVLRGRYAFWLPGSARFGDGLLLHRLVRRSLTHLLEQLASAMEGHGYLATLAVRVDRAVEA